MRLELELGSKRDSPSVARLALDAWSDRLDPILLENLRLVVSELVTNSVKFAPGNAIRLQLCAEPPDRAWGEVKDYGHGEVAIRWVEEPGAGGLGLRIVDSLAERWGVHEDSTHVWFELAA